MQLPICGECGHQRTADESALPLLECPKCKTPYAWSKTLLPDGYAPATHASAVPAAASDASRRRVARAPEPAKPRAGIYVDSTMAPGESIIYTGKLHWIIFAPGVFFLSLGLMGIAGTPEGETSGGITFFVWLGLFLLVRAAIMRYSTELAITSRRVVAKVGFIRRDTIDLNHSKIESYSVNQGVLGRILNYGTVIVRGTGGAYTPIRGVADPIMFRRSAAELSDEKQG